MLSRISARLSVIFCFVIFSVFITSCSTNSEEKKYYDKGVIAYEKEDYSLALSFFEKVKDYDDAEIYISTIEEKMEAEIEASLVEKMEAETEASLEEVEATPVPTEASKSKEQENYDKGVEAYEAGDYELALSYFEKSGDYEDSAAYIKALKNKLKIMDLPPMPNS